MSSSTTIEWTRDAAGGVGGTWNPVTGCTKVSPGCAHCYAETFAERFRDVPGHAYEQGFDLKLWPERLELPLRWRRPRLIFVNSMSDLFHEQVPEEFIRHVFEVMARASHHRFQLLTKRHERLVEVAPRLPWPDNVWIGVSIENRRFVHRADYLRQVPAAVRFISAEPLLGPLEGLRLDGIDWLIVGGESGPGARPMHPSWAMRLRDECQAAEVAFFFKQWGAYVPEEHPQGVRPGALVILDANGRRWSRPPELVPAAVAPVRLRRVGKGRAGRVFDGRTWDQLPVTRRPSVDGSHSSPPCSC
jgi:protein gp37